MICNHRDREKGRGGHLPDAAIQCQAAQWLTSQWLNTQWLTSQWLTSQYLGCDLDCRTSLAQGSQ